jgi:hypothetical protein
MADCREDLARHDVFVQVHNPREPCDLAGNPPCGQARYQGRYGSHSVDLAAEVVQHVAPLREFDLDREVG